MKIISVEDFSIKLRNLIDSRFRKHTDFYKEFDKKYDTNISQTCKQWLAGNNFPKIDHIVYLCDFFDCDIEYLLTNQKEFKQTDKKISDITGLSQDSIRIIRNLDYLDKITFDRLIAECALLPYFTQTIKRMLAFHAYRTDAKIVLSDTLKKVDNGLVTLEDTLNQSDMKTLIYSTVDTSVHNALSTLLKDEELQDIFFTHYMRTSVKVLLSDESLPQKATNVDETAKQMNKESDD